MACVATLTTRPAARTTPFAARRGCLRPHRVLQSQLNFVRGKVDLRERDAKPEIIVRCKLYMAAITSRKPQDRLWDQWVGHQHRIRGREGTLGYLR